MVRRWLSSGAAFCALAPGLTLSRRSLGPLLRRATEPGVAELVDGLLSRLLSGPGGGSARVSARETGALGLKELLSAAAPGAPAAEWLARRAAPRLAAVVGGGGGAPSPEALLDCLDLLADLLQRFGHLASSEHEGLRASLLAHATGAAPQPAGGPASGAPARRKKAAAALAALAPSLCDASLVATGAAAAGFVAATGGAAAAVSPSAAEAHKGATSLYAALLRSAGPRLGHTLGAALPALEAAAGGGASRGTDEGADDAAEGAVAALEAAASRCAPADIAPHWEALCRCAAAAIKFDPNCAAEEGAAGDDGMDDDGADDDDDGDGDGDDAYSDDEDGSWKVRRCGVRLVAALLGSAAASAPTDGGARLGSAAATLGPHLVARLGGEREASVRADVCASLHKLLASLSAPSASRSPPCDAALRSLLPPLVNAALGAAGGGSGGGRASAASTPSTAAGGPHRSRAAAFELLVAAVDAAGGMAAGGGGGGGGSGGDSLLSPLVPPLAAAAAAALSERPAASGATSGLKGDALRLARALLRPSSKLPPASVAASLPSLLPPVVAAASDRYYKTAAEALRTLGECVPSLVVGVEGVCPPCDSLVGPAFAAVSSQLASPDADGEVRDAAAAAAGAFVAKLGMHSGVDARSAVAQLLSRASHDATRASALAALATIAASPAANTRAGEALSAVGAPLCSELCSALRRASRPHRASACAALSSLVHNHPGAVPVGCAADAVASSACLVSDADLAAAVGALNLTAAALRLRPSEAGPAAAAATLPAALRLLPSPLVGGGSAAVAALRRFFHAAASPAVTSLPGQPGLDALLDAVGRAAAGAHGSKPAASTAAECVAAAAAGAGGGAVASTAAALVATLLPAAKPSSGGKAGQAKAQATTPSPSAPGSQSSHSPSPATLLAIGELGRRVDLSATPAAGVLVACCDAASEEASDAAARALGAVATANPAAFLPFITAPLVEGATRGASGSGSGGGGGDGRRAYALLRALRVLLAPPAHGDACDSPRDGSEPPPPTAVGAADAPPLLRLLVACGGSPEEGARAAASECLGCALVSHTGAAAPLLRSVITAAPPQPPPSDAHSPALARAAAVHAVRVAVAEGGSSCAEPLVDDALSLIDADDHRLRHAACALLCALAHHAPALASPRLAHPSRAAAGLCACTRPVPSLVRVVDLGPFKHSIDDGLELRKAACECVDVVMGALPGALAPPDIAAAALSGLGDAYDVKMCAHGLMAKLCASSPAAAAAVADAAAVLLEKTLAAKLKSDAVKQEIDRNDDLVRSALRAVSALARVPSAAASPGFAAFAAALQKGPLAQKYAAVEADAAGGAGGANGDGVVPMEV